MTDILRQVAASRHSRYIPTSTDEYFVLRLARGLGEPEAAPHYALLASQYSNSQLLYAYHNAVGTNHGKPARIFHEYLSGLKSLSNEREPRPRLLAINVGRRSVAVALFSGFHLEGWRMRHLSSDPVRAESAAVGFTREVLSEHPCPAAAFESTSSAQTARTFLQCALVAELRNRGISMWEIAGKTVMSAMGHPSPKGRVEVRDIMRQMWHLPSRVEKQARALDTFALGVYVQTERLFAVD